MTFIAGFFKSFHPGSEVLEGFLGIAMLALLHIYNCSLSQLVIAWTAAQEGITHVLCGARKQAHITNNVLAGDIELEAPDQGRIRLDVEAL